MNPVVWEIPEATLLFWFASKLHVRLTPGANPWEAMEVWNLLEEVCKMIEHEIGQPTPSFPPEAVKPASSLVLNTALKLMPAG